MSDVKKFVVRRSDNDGDDWVTLFDSEGNVITEGDWYHDKIDEVINGFFLAFDYLEEVVEVEYKN